ncbi:tyrosine-protein phosphatase [Parabacteroides distasonis]|uniref:tyrosine-protein phosphatase n=1 Tax=Parabacteroides distasonis TaxID=823 RepID=UPI0021C9963A|nr:tyrosine-protein phosphatase [Parabacteroides distasonis]
MLLAPWISRDAIMEDYLTSNQYIDTSHLADIVKHLSTTPKKALRYSLRPTRGSWT